MMDAKAAVYFTISMGVKASPAAPPMVPRIPEMDLINVTYVYVFKDRKFNAARSIAKFINKGIDMSSLCA
jgi:hypothetical protein